MTLHKKQYPVKTTVNLMIRERSAYRLSRVLCGAAIVALVVFAFAKFAVVDRLNAAARAESAAAAAEQRLAALREENTAYDSVRVEYARYFSAGQTAGAALPVSCMEVLDLVERSLMPEAGIASLDYTGGVLTLQLTGADLNRASGILADLYQSPLVSSVEIYTADAGNGEAPAEGASIAMTVTLQAEGGGAE